MSCDIEADCYIMESYINRLIKEGENNMPPRHSISNCSPLLPMTRIVHYLLLVLPPVMPAPIRRRHPPNIFVPLLPAALQVPMTKVVSKLKTLERPTDSYDT